LKKFDAAAQTFETLLEDDPKYAAMDKVLYELAWAYKSQEKPAEALSNFAKLAADYPQSPLAGEALFHVGEDRYQNAKYQEAASSYAQSKQAAGKSELGEKATYKLGWSHYQLKQYDEALEQFTEQVETYPESSLVADGMFMRAECLFKLENFQEALPVFTAAQQALAANENASPDIKVLLLLHGGQSAAQLKQWDESLAFLESIPADFPTSTYVPEALYEIAWVKQNQGKPDEALTLYEQAATKSRGDVGARSRFMLGELYFTDKKYDKAIPEFQRAMFGFGGDNAPAEVKKWQAKSGYEAGRCAEVQIAETTDPAARAKLIANAKEFYNYVVQKHPQDPLAAEAQKRLEVLATLK
jgi:TolA-binding protein